MKILLDKYPMTDKKRSFKGQKSPGKYINDYYYRNLDILSKAIVNDMTFLAVIWSSTLEVGTGKSVFATQMGEAWSYLMKKNHNLDIPFTCNNIVWRPKELMKRAFEVPKYSMILLDEWEDAHYWSELGMTLRQFFRKCRQLNLFIVLIIPNFFQLPMNYATGRSIFGIDVRFEDGFTRGNFRFYNFNAKRNLYIMGKKIHNFNAQRPTFLGRFTDGYGVNEKEYRKAKLLDLEKWESLEPEKQTLSQIKFEMVKRMVEENGMTKTDAAKVVGVTPKTVFEWFKKAKMEEKEANYKPNPRVIPYNE